MPKQFLIKTIGFGINLTSYISKNLAAKSALNLFSKPLKGRPNESQSNFLSTAFKEELTYKNQSIMSYRWLGKQDTILLVHGWESNAARWKKLIQYLQQKDYNIIALDAPGHGFSGGKSFNALLYSEYINVVVKKFNPSVIIGHSVGGMASVFFQNKYNVDTINKIILLGAPSEFTDVLDRYTDMLGYNNRVKNQLITLIIERFGAAPENFSSSKKAKNITSKGLIIHDELDQIIPYTDALLIKDSFKGSKFITTSGYGHSLNNDVVSSHINDFIEA